MKYIKKYEFGGKEPNTNKNYKVGDFIVIDFEAVKHNNIHDEWPTDIYCEITDSHNIGYHDYEVKFQDNLLYYITDDEVERKMTQQEIEEFKIKNDINKYNL